MPCTPGGTTTPLLGLCKPAAGETPWTTAVNGNWDILDSLQAAVVARGYLAGLVLSTAGSSTTMTTAVGQAVDSANASVMVLASAINKTTSSWTVGSGNGGLDTGAIAAKQWGSLIRHRSPILRHALTLGIFLSQLTPDFIGDLLFDVGRQGDLSPVGGICLSIGSRIHSIPIGLLQGRGDQVVSQPK